MSTTEALRNGDGSTVTFNFPFEYLEESDVKVSVDGLVKTQDTDYTFSSLTEITFVTAPPVGTGNVRIFRETEIDNLRTQFFAGVPNPQYHEGRRLWDQAEWPNGAPEGGLLGLPPPYCEPFRRMLDCPALVFRLNWMMGAGWALPHIGRRMDIRTTRRGDAGLFLHAAGVPAGPTNQLTWFNGNCHCEYVNVTWQVRNSYLLFQTNFKLRSH